ncbi:hypothetical protein PG985_005628 [Apiospora marii]|uniref:uncharacterized protein n=1 Tax=Apiospora marii TaxID=335849 RepID=UPI00312DC357
MGDILDSMGQRYVPLLPALGTRDEGEQSSAFGAQAEASKRKRIGTQIACNFCRIKKIKASPAVMVDGRFVALAENEPPKQRAFDALRVLRANKGDCIAALPLIKGTLGEQPMFGPMQPNEIPVQSPLDIHLMTRHPIAYPMLSPIATENLKENSLLRPGESVHPRLFSCQHPLVPLDTIFLESRFGNDAYSAVNRYRAYGAQEDSLVVSRRYCDERLSSLRISSWTTVQINDELAARIISLYLEVDHPLLGTFDPNLFVADLISVERRHCSSLLVNALLYWGCQMYSAIDQTVTKLAQSFCVEAEKLWSETKHADTCLNMAGAQLLSLAYMGHGKDHHCLEYLAEAVNMGTRLGLFVNLNDNEKNRQHRSLSMQDLSAASFAAWGVFNWSILTATFYRQQGLVYPQFPPWVPIPGDTGSDWAESSTESSSTDETSLKLQSTSSYMGTTFPYLCQFWQIVHGFALRIDGKNSSSELLSLEFAEMKFRELLAWVQNLPAAQIRREGSPHHVVIFQPFVSDPTMRHASLKTFSAPRSSPDRVYHASVEQLKHLIIGYRAAYESSACTFLWHTALAYVANAVLASNDQDWKMIFLLCIYGYESLARPYRVSEAIGTSLLTMALRDHRISTDEARNLRQQLKNRKPKQLEDVGPIRATFMGDLQQAMSDPGGAKVESLANNFEDMALFREFLNDEEANDMS